MATETANSSESVLALIAKNKYISGGILASLVGLVLFFVMVLLISLGDSGIKDDNSVKLVDIVMPDRDIDTLLQEVDKPDEPEEQPDDIAQPELELQPLTGVDVTIAKPKANIKAGGSFFKLNIQEELRKEAQKALLSLALQLLNKVPLRMQLL